jgi:hypothetical protein
MGAAFVALGAGGMHLAREREVQIEQPIAFDHARHAVEGMACLDCHARAADGAYATTPRLAACMLCHAEPKGEHPDEPRLREIAEAGGEIAWVQVNRLPGHVYFSHEAHVTWAEMECADCHGRMEEATLPPARSQIDGLTMTRCMECHEERGARNDCIDCHK